MIVGSTTSLIVFSSRSGLLYFRGSNATRDFIAVQLEDGQLAVRTRVDGRGPFVLRTNGSDFADGRVHRLRAIRQNRQLTLQVGCKRLLGV